MKRNKIATCILRGILGLSLFILLFSVYHILMNHYKIDQARKMAAEQSVTPVNILPNPVHHYSSPKKVASPQPKMDLLYTRRPQKGDVFGTLYFPSINQNYPIVEGTDDKDLGKGVGHYIGSVLPGETDNTVLAGHRDTVFTKLGNIKIGDRVIIKTYAGTFTYQVQSHRIVNGDDRTVIVPTKGPMLTLITCYPFHYIGHAPKRYILVAELISSVKAEK